MLGKNAEFQIWLVGHFCKKFGWFGQNIHGGLIKYFIFFQFSIAVRHTHFQLRLFRNLKNNFSIFFLFLVLASYVARCGVVTSTWKICNAFAWLLEFSVIFFFFFFILSVDLIVLVSIISCFIFIKF